MPSSILPMIRVATLLLVTSLGAPSIAAAQLTHGNGPRLRVGIEAGLGPNPGLQGGATAGAYGQLGVQINRQFALFYQPSFGLHVSGSNPSVRLLAGSDHLLMTDVTFGPFQLGLGAGVSATPPAACDANTGCASNSYSLRPVVGARIAIVVAVPGVRARWGVPIAANLHVAEPAGSDRSTALVFTIGIQRY